MLVVDELAAEFEVEFVEHFDAVFDLFLLDLEIFFGIKTFFHFTSLLFDLLYHFLKNNNMTRQCGYGIITV